MFVYFIRVPTLLVSSYFILFQHQGYFLIVLIIEKKNVL